MRYARLALGLVFLTLVAPLVVLALRAFTPAWVFPDVVPRSLTTRGMQTAFGSGSHVVQGLLLSLEVGTAVAVLSCLIGWPAARALGLYRFRGRRAVQILLLSPVIVPAMAAAMGLQVFFIRAGLAGTATGVVLVQLIPALPYATTILAAGFANFDADYESQARVLGAGAARRALRVTFPQLRAPLAAAALLSFLISWSDYLLALLIGAGQVQTLPIQLFAAINATDTTTAAAVALLVIVPPLLLVAASAGPLSRASTANIGRGLQ